MMRVHRRAAAPGAAGTGRAVDAETRCLLAAHLGTRVVLGGELEIAMLADTVRGLVLEADVGEVNVSTAKGQVVITGECLACVGRGRAVLRLLVHPGAGVTLIALTPSWGLWLSLLSAATVAAGGLLAARAIVAVER